MSTKLLGAEWTTIEMAPQGKRKTGQKVRFTNSPSGNGSELTESGALTADLTKELTQVVLLACVHEEDIGYIDELMGDYLNAVAVASALRLAIQTRQQRVLGSMLKDFGFGTKNDVAVDKDGEANPT